VSISRLYRFVSSCHFRLELLTCGRGTGPSQGRLGPRPERLQKAQVSRTVRGVTSAKSSRCNATVTTDVISPNLQKIKLSGDRQSRCAVSVRLVGVLGRLILRAIQRRGLSALNRSSRPYFGWSCPTIAQRF